MTRPMSFRLGLIIRSTAYAQRSPRTQLDVALLAASLDCDLNLYFVGAGALQLIQRGNSAGALLPNAYRAWASLPDLFETSELLVFAEAIWLERLQASKLQLCLPAQACSASGMREHWADCDRVMVI
jgi:sulfur relay (sulfurtransferase) DsrF/TusC family protein